MEEMGIAPSAEGLNKKIAAISPAVFDCLSVLGRKMYYPAGILTQTAEAKAKSPRFDATIGIALEGHDAMHLSVIDQYFNNLHVNDIYPYAPSAGLNELRQIWKRELIQKNPSLHDKAFSLPVVTSALTNGLSLAGELLANKNDVLIIPNKYWGVYDLNLKTKMGCKTEIYRMFNDQKGFNTEAFSESVKTAAAATKKLIIILNFPNNPTGYTPTAIESESIVKTIKDQADKGTRIVTILDDAYFGLFYEDSIKESLFCQLCNLHENILAVKVDGATKECFAWGFRTGFLTFGTKTENHEELYSALEEKIKGLIRATLSSSNHPSQVILLKSLKDPQYKADAKLKFEILKKRALRLKEILNQEKFKDDWAPYPFNSGYFMCLKLTKVNAESLRLHLLSQYKVGTISIGATDLRIAFSCIEEADMEELIDLIHQGVKDLS